MSMVSATIGTASGSAERGGSDARDRAVGVTQHESRDVGHRQAPHGAIEVHGPQRRAISRRRSVADDERRVRQIELEIERVARTCAHRERRVELDVHRHPPPCPPWIWMSLTGTLVPPGSGKPLCGLLMCKILLSVGSQRRLPPAVVI
jgi:hypothetical protein